MKTPSSHDQPQLGRGTKPIPHAQEPEAKKLAQLLASELNQPDRLAEFERLCLRESHDRIRSVLNRVREIPQEKIKKSRVALFYFLLKHDPDADN